MAQSRSLLFTVVTVLTVSAPAAAQILVDGMLAGDESKYGPARSIQNTDSQYDNATNGDLRYAVSGSEIDQVFAVVSAARLYVLVAGNLESNFNKLDIFIDSVPGGVNKLDGANLPASVDPHCCGEPPTPTAALQRMSGLQFDAGFNADRYITFSNGNEKYGNSVSTTYSLSSYYADLSNGAAGAKSEVGFERNALGVEPGLEQGEPIDQLNNGCPGPAGPCSPPEHELAEPIDVVNDPGNNRNHRNFLNNIGLRMAINNSNTAGVVLGIAQTSGNPQAVTTGIEFSLPLATLGNPTGEIKITAFINSSTHSFVSNQFAGTGVLRGNLAGSLSTINLATIAGNQYVSVFAPPPGDYNGDFRVDAADYTLWRDTLGSTTDLRANGDDSGASADIVDQADFDFWKTYFGAPSGSGSGAIASGVAPEPTTISMLLLGVLAVLLHRSAPVMCSKFPPVFEPDLHHNIYS